MMESKQNGAQLQFSLCGPWHTCGLEAAIPGGMPKPCLNIWYASFSSCLCTAPAMYTVPAAQAHDGMHLL